jgi:hypothetical protein
VPAALVVNGSAMIDARRECQRTSTAGDGTGRVFTVTGNLTIGSNVNWFITAPSGTVLLIR